MGDAVEEIVERREACGSERAVCIEANVNINVTTRALGSAAKGYGAFSRLIETSSQKSRFP